MPVTDHRASGSITALGCAVVLIVAPVAAAVALVAWAVIAATP